MEIELNQCAMRYEQTLFQEYTHSRAEIASELSQAQASTRRCESEVLLIRQQAERQYTLAVERHLTEETRLRDEISQSTAERRILSTAMRREQDESRHAESLARSTVEALRTEIRTQRSLFAS
jgi:predicted protein tyrosine phosphatase